MKLEKMKERRKGIERSLSFNLTMKYGTEVGGIVKMIQWVAKVDSLELKDEYVVFEYKSGERLGIKRSTFPMDLPQRSTSEANRFKVLLGARIDKSLIKLREI